MSDEWLEQLQELQNQDQARRASEEAREAQAQAARLQRRQQARSLLNDVRAHELLRQLQRAFLAGGGELRFYETVGDYDEAIVLNWMGPISAAQKPTAPEDADGTLVVGVRQGQVEVNGVRLSTVTDEGLQQLLLAACRQWVARFGSDRPEL